MRSGGDADRSTDGRIARASNLGIKEGPIFQQMTATIYALRAAIWRKEEREGGREGVGLFEMHERDLELLLLLRRPRRGRRHLAHEAAALERGPGRRGPRCSER